MTPQTETLAGYIPALIARRLAVNPAPPLQPAAESLPAALLSAKISGLAPLTAALTQPGAPGADALAPLFNDYFGRLADLITAHGGDVLTFAGKHLLALWSARAGLLPG
ncbi:MAG: hypothetical protein ACE5G8_18185, partial [Anaerolineae bacterium]